MDELPQSIMRRLDNGDTVWVSANSDKESCEKLVSSATDATEPCIDESISFLIDDICISEEAEKLKQLVNQGESSFQDEDKSVPVVEDYGKEETIGNVESIVCNVNLKLEDTASIKGNAKVNKKITTEVSSLKRKSSAVLQHSKKKLKESNYPVKEFNMKTKTLNKDCTVPAVASSVIAGKGVNQETTKSNNTVSKKSKMPTNVSVVLEATSSNENAKVDKKVTTETGSSKRKSSVILQHYKRKIKESKSPVKGNNMKIKPSIEDSIRVPAVGSSLNTGKSVNWETRSSNDKVSTKAKMPTENDTSIVAKKSTFKQINMFETTGNMKISNPQVAVGDKIENCTNESKNTTTQKSTLALNLPDKNVSLKKVQEKVVEKLTQRKSTGKTINLQFAVNTNENSSKKFVNKTSAEKSDLKVNVAKKRASTEKEKKMRQNKIESKNDTSSLSKRKSTSIYQRRHEIVAKSKVAIDTEKPLFEKPAPPGWKCHTVQRKNGKTAGKYDVYYYSPSGKKFRSSVEIAAYLKETNDTSCNTEDFNFSVSTSTPKKKKENKALTVSGSPQQGNINRKEITKLLEDNSTDAVASSSSSTPFCGSKKKSSSTGILDKLIPPLSNNKSLITSSLFTTNFNKRTQGKATNNALKKKKLLIKLHKNTSTSKSASTSTKQHTLKKQTSNSSYANHIKKLKILQKQSHLKGPPNRLLMKNTTLSKINFENSFLKKKQKGRSLKSREYYEPPKFTVSEERKLISQIPHKILVVALVNCDNVVPISCKRDNIKSETMKTPTQNKANENIVIENVSEDNGKEMLLSEGEKNQDDKVVDNPEINKKESSIQVFAQSSDNDMKAEEGKKVVTNGDANKDEVKLPVIDNNGKENQDKNKRSATVQNTNNEEFIAPLIKAVDKTWTPPKSPYKLIYEQLYSEPWKLLLATIIMKYATAKVGTTLTWKFLEIYPTLSLIKNATIDELQHSISAMDKPLNCAKKLQLFAKEFDTKSWLYPIELASIGKYGNDAYRIFCTSEWHEVKPEDYDLRIYLDWAYQNQKSKCGVNSSIW